MNRKIIVTDDNSKSLLIPEWNETYHSIHGAKNESQHVFIKHGLERVVAQHNSIKLLEIGFGTGLNALLTYNFIKNTPIYIAYDAVEKFPLSLNVINELEHPKNTGLDEHQATFEKMHTSAWNTEIKISSNFLLKKIAADITILKLAEEQYSLIYFDAFGPKIQPELWQLSQLQKMHNTLVNGGLLVTYCAQGQFKRDLIAAGFKIESFPGPKGKREMTCAIKS